MNTNFMGTGSIWAHFAFAGAMPDERESAVAAWLDNASTKKEIAIARQRLAKMGSGADAVLFALGIEILAALEIYGCDTETDADSPYSDLDDDDLPWRSR